jgi:hypothetical protein
MCKQEFPNDPHDDANSGWALSTSESERLAEIG